MPKLLSSNHLMMFLKWKIESLDDVVIPPVDLQPDELGSSGVRMAEGQLHSHLQCSPAHEEQGVGPSECPLTDE